MPNSWRIEYEEHISKKLYITQKRNFAVPEIIYNPPMEGFLA